MPAKLQRCFQRVLPQMIKRGMSQDKADSAARAICAKTTKLKWKREYFDEEDLLCERVDDISTENNRYIYLAGTALVPGVSRNLVNYTEEEIKRAYTTLEGQKVNANHDHFSPPIGRVLTSILGESKQVNFVMEIDTMINPASAAALESGYIDHVSIEAQPEWVECSICGCVYGECSHYKGMKYKSKNGSEEVCTIIPHNFEFTGLAIVYNREGVPAAQIAQERVPTFIEKLSEKKEKREKTMSEKVEVDVQELLRKAREKWEEEHSQEVEILKEQKSEFQKKAEETRKEKEQLEKRERQRIAREIAVLETKVLPKSYPEKKMTEREKELFTWSLSKLETRMKILGEVKDNNKEDNTVEESSQHKGGFIDIVKEKKVNLSEEARKAIKLIEHKRIIERALGFNKPLKEDFVEYCIDNELVFKKEPKIE
nr:MAG: hypothetical protein [Lokiarchaeota virus Ratatoskr Meg22_1012]